MKRQHWSVLGAALITLAGGQVQAQITKTLLFEDFDSVVLGDSVNEREGFPIVTREASDVDSEPIANAFTTTAPAGWTVDNNLGQYQGAPTIGNAGVPGQGLPSFGVDEWEGWTFADKDFWASVDDQDRGMFTNAIGTVAVADPDEYFDLGDQDDPANGGYFNSGLKTPSIPLTANTIYSLSFDSSWRDESFDDTHPTAGPNLNNQAAEVVIRFNDGSSTVVTPSGLAWNSDPLDGGFKDDNPNESLSGNFGVPAGATAATIEFNIANAGNDWWWAIDNISVDGIAGVDTGINAFAEDFEGLVLGDSVNERRSLIADKVTAVNNDAETTPRANAFSHTPPAGWNIDNSNTPAATLGDDNVGVFEYEGWSIMTREFWGFAGQEGGANAFENGSGNIAVADGDEWDDLGDPSDLGELNTLLDTPAVDLSGLAPGEELAIQFDSSWRYEDSQTAVLMVDLNDGNGPQELLRWESDPNSVFFKEDAQNENVLVRFDPNGAPSATFSFQYIGTNDWWWAVDNVRVGVIPEPSAAALLTLGSLLIVRRRNG